MSKVKEAALVFVQDTFEAFKVECYSCRYLERSYKGDKVTKACRVLQGKASIIDCPALRNHFSLYGPKT